MAEVRAITKAVDGAIVFGTGLVVTLPVLVVLEHTVLLALFAGGVGLIVLRWLFLWTSPWMAAHSTFVAFVVNAVVDFCRLAWLFFSVLEDSLSDILKAISDLADDLGADINIDLPKLQPKFDVTAAVSARQVHETLTTIVETCHPYDDAYTVIGRVIKSQAGGYTCAVVRYVYPVNWMRAVLEPLLSPFYDGSADPFSTHDNEANCLAASGESASVSIICSSLGAGYVVIEVLLPLLLFAILVVAIWDGVRKLVVGTIELAGETTVLLIEKTDEFLLSRI